MDSVAFHAVPELLLTLFRFCDGRDMARLCSVSWWFNMVGSDQEIWHRLLDQDFPVICPMRPKDIDEKEYYGELFHSWNAITDAQSFLSCPVTSTRKDLIILHYTSGREWSQEVPLAVMKRSITANDHSLMEWSLCEGYAPGDDMLFDIATCRRTELALLLVKNLVEVEYVIDMAIITDWIEFIRLPQIRPFLTVEHLNIAIEHGQWGCVEFFDTIGIFVSIQSLQSAAAHHDHVAFKYALDQGVIPNNTVIEAVVKKDNLEAMKLMVDEGIVIPPRFITMAVMHDALAIAKWMTNDGDGIERNHLRTAVEWGSMYTVDWLIRDVQIQPSCDEITVALMNGQIEIVQYLICYGVLPDHNALNCMPTELMLVMIDRGMSYTQEELDGMFDHLTNDTLDNMDYAGLIELSHTVQ